MTMPQRIDRIYAWICTNNDGVQIIPRVEMDGMLLPLSGPDKEHVAAFRNYAYCIATENNLIINFVSYGEPEILETYVPDDSFMESN